MAEGCGGNRAVGAGKPAEVREAPPKCSSSATATKYPQCSSRAMHRDTGEGRLHSGVLVPDVIGGMITSGLVRSA
jgi:hypothetical protein